MNSYIGWALILTAIPAGALLVIASSMVGWRQSLGHLACYCVDAGMAFTGFTLGFGMHVVNWWWVLIPLIPGRFAFYIVNQLYFSERAKADFEALRRARCELDRHPDCAVRGARSNG